MTMPPELPPLPPWLEKFDWSDGYSWRYNDEVKAQVIADVQAYARTAIAAAVLAEREKLKLVAWRYGCPGGVPCFSDGWAKPILPDDGGWYVTPLYSIAPSEQKP